MILLTVYRRRAACFVLTMAQSDGSNLTLSSGDVVRLKIGIDGREPLLDLGSDEPTAAGSRIVAANPANVDLKADDTDFPPGVWEAELSVYDASQTTPKLVDKGMCAVHDTQLGEVGA